MDAGFGAQRAVRIITAYLDRRALDAGHFAGGLVEKLGLEVAPFGKTQIHALEHAGPVLRFGAAGASLDLDEAVVRVERVVEHAAELEIVNLFRQPADVRLDRSQRRIIVVRARDLEKLRGVTHVLFERLHAPDHVFQQLFFAPEFLRALRLVPDLGVFEFLADFPESTDLHIDVKGTSATRPTAW